MTETTVANSQAIAQMQSTIASLTNQIGDVNALTAYTNDPRVAASGGQNGGGQGPGVLVQSLNPVPSGERIASIGPIVATVSEPPTIVGAINRNTSAISFNTAEIQQNALAIANNTQALNDMSTILQQLDSVIAQNDQRITQLERGLSALAAMPDIGLSSDENFSFTGRVSMYEGEVGFGLGLAIRTHEDFSIGATVGHSRDQTSGAVQFRFSQ